MRTIDQASARFLILKVAAIYLVLVGLLEMSSRVSLVNSFTAAEWIQSLTTLASLTVGCVIGFYLASRPRQS